MAEEDDVAHALNLLASVSASGISQSTMQYAASSVASTIGLVPESKPVSAPVEFEDDEPSGRPQRKTTSGQSRARADDYFVENAVPAPQTSSHTFSELGLLKESERAEILDHLPVKHAEGKQALLTHYRSQYRKWFTQLRAGMNLCFYGCGSKKALLEEFSDQWLNDSYRLVINGYFPALTIRQLLSAIQKDVLSTAHEVSTFTPRLRSAAQRFGHVSAGFADSDAADDPAASPEVDPKLPRQVRHLVRASPNHAVDKVVAAAAQAAVSSSSQPLLGDTPSSVAAIANMALSSEAPRPIFDGASNAESMGALTDAAAAGDIIIQDADQALLQQVQAIGAKLANPRSSVRRLYIIVHNIDGPSLRDRNTQQVLAALAALPQVHLCASIDHVNAPLLWDFALLDRFSWVWHDTTTFAPYRLETAFVPAVVGAPAESRARSIQYVLQSLTPNHRNILILLAKAQLGSPEGAFGWTFEQWFAASQDEMLVLNDTAFRAHLQELLDHDILQHARSTVKGADNSMRYTIPYDVETIRTCVLNLPPSESALKSSTAPKSTAPKRSPDASRPTIKAHLAQQSASKAKAARAQSTKYVPPATPVEDVSMFGKVNSRHGQVPLVPAQRSVLEQAFAVNAYPTAEERAELCKVIGRVDFDEFRCMNWFRNARQAATRAGQMLAGTSNAAASSPKPTNQTVDDGDSDTERRRSSRKRSSKSTYDDDSDDSDDSQSKRRKRSSSSSGVIHRPNKTQPKVLTQEERAILEDHFATDPQPSRAAMEALVKRINREDFNETRCANWFVNRRWAERQK